MTKNNKTLSLYIHVPFCVAKCGYCSFYSLPVKQVCITTALIESWLDAVALESRLWRERLGCVKLRTLYIGGGTPSLLSPEQWRRLLDVIQNFAELDTTLLEATVEANPSSLTPEHLALWRDSFITRVSLGVQSLNDNELRCIGRLHNAKEALLAMERVRARGLDLSADLIFGLPNQTLRTWATSLRGVLDAGAQHVSTYQLTLEPDTPMGRKSPTLPDGYPFYRYAQWFLPQKGFIQYEISNFADLEHECRHNLAYWRQENVLALGPAAWGYLDGRRYANPSTLESYLAAAQAGFPNPLANGETLLDRQRAIEYAILALRTRYGIDRADFVARFGSNILSEITNILTQIPSRLVCKSDNKIALTPAGMRVGNAIWAELITLC